MIHRLAVFGNPVAHSRSPEIHATFAEAAGIDLTYERIEAPVDHFAKAARDFIEQGCDGFNVTVPFKREAFELVDRPDRSALASGTVNTVIVADGILEGSNTDGVGLLADLENNLGWSVSGRRILILGAGGAVQGVLPHLLARRPATVHILNRTHERAQALAEREEGVEAVTAAAVESDYDLVISGSAAGLVEREVDPVPSRVLGENTCCYDMIYGAGETPFIRWAHRFGCERGSDGLGMLVEQAAASFALWFDVQPATQPVIRQLRTSLG